jgi:hypothetical protein
MGVFDFFKSKEYHTTTDKLDEEQLSEIVKEIVISYDGLYTDISRPFKECSDRKARAIRIGSEIPLIAMFDFGNFSNLLFNNLNLEIKDKIKFTFVQEQSTLYVLFSDRHLFSRLGNEGRNKVMEALESGYLNKMMNLANDNEAAWHYSKKHILEREKETPQCGSINDFIAFYQIKLMQRIELENNNAFVSFLLTQIISVGTTVFAMKMLSTLTDEEG